MDCEVAAWEHIVIAPQMVGDISWAKTSLDTVKGKVGCHWTRDLQGTSWTMDVIIPEGADAKVILPDGNIAEVGPGTHHFED